MQIVFQHFRNTSSLKIVLNMVILNYDLKTTLFQNHWNYDWDLLRICVQT